MSIKNDILNQTGLITRKKYINESKETEFKIKKMEIISRINEIFKRTAQDLRGLKYDFSSNYNYPREEDIEEIAMKTKQLQEFKEEMYKDAINKYKELKLFIDDAFGKKEEPEIKDDDYEGEEDETE